MKNKATIYHAGWPRLRDGLGQHGCCARRQRYDGEVVHLGNQKTLVAEAERAGVKSVPALVLGGTTYHINFGTDIEALR